MWNLPEEYKKGITRVSDIVSYVFPFKGTEDERRYLDWLYNNWIDEKLYLQYAQDMGTEVHNKIEDYVLDELDEDISIHNEVKNEIKHWVQFIDSLWYKEIYTEKYCRDINDRYQGTCDLLYKDNDDKWVLADWKTYWICKKRFPQLKAKDKIPPIATKKKKKVHLQMSLYAKALYEREGIKVERIELLYLHELGIKVVEFDIIPFNEIDEILIWFYENKFKLKEKNMSIEYPFKVTMQTAPIAYSMAKIELDLKDLDWVTPEESINKMILSHEKLHNDMKERYGN